MISIAPTHQLLFALHHQNLTWKKILAELIDNSFDAGAARVTVKLGPGRTVEITDDGAGCKNPVDMVHLGKRTQYETTNLGMYGVGAKDAAIWLWGQTEIETIHRGKLTRAFADWQKISQDGWEIQAPEEHDTDQRSGTTIRFKNIVRRLPGNREALMADLGYLFFPALRQGRQVVFQSGRQSFTCAPFSPPPLEAIIEAEAAVSGKSIRIHAGIVPEGYQNLRPGFTYTHRHRVIIPYTSMGAGGLSTNRVVGTVELLDGWSRKLTKNKDDIAEDKDELAEAVFSACRATLEKSDQQAQLFEFAALKNEVSQKLNDIVGGISSRREKRDQTREVAGTITPKGTGRERRRAKKTSDAKGKVASAARGGLRMEWFAIDEPILGDADLHGGTVRLNLNHAYLKRLRADENSDALALCCVMLFTHAVTDRDQGVQKYLRGLEPGNFVEVVSGVLSAIPDEQPNGKRRRA